MTAPAPPADLAGPDPMLPAGTLITLTPEQFAALVASGQAPQPRKTSADLLQEKIRAELDGRADDLHLARNEGRAVDHADPQPGQFYGRGYTSATIGHPTEDGVSQRWTVDPDTGCLIDRVDELPRRARRS